VEEGGKGEESRELGCLGWVKSLGVGGFGVVEGKGRREGKGSGNGLVDMPNVLLGDGTV